MKKIIFSAGIIIIIVSILSSCCGKCKQGVEWLDNISFYNHSVAELENAILQYNNDTTSIPLSIRSSNNVLVSIESPSPINIYSTFTITLRDSTAYVFSNIKVEEINNRCCKDVTYLCNYRVNGVLYTDRDLNVK